MRRTRSFLAAALVLTTIGLTGGVGQAATESARYTAGTGGTDQRNLVNPLGLTGNNGIGGFDFPGKPGLRPTKIRVLDDVTGRAGIGVLVCAPSCGQLQRGWCTDNQGWVILPSLPLGSEINIGIAFVETGMIWAGTAPCDNNAVTGTITVTYN
jgi:hypothetical protein